MASRKVPGILIAATGQHVGKTTSCLGLVHALRQRVNTLAYCKPVGQQHVEVGPDGLRVDKDCFLFKEHFGLPHDYADISPVLFPRGFTRDVLDGKVTSGELMTRIQAAVRRLQEQSDYVLCEGTGHVGVGSVCGLNNAQVAAGLGMDAVVVAKGGVGSSFDELMLNKALLDAHGVRLRGVVLNQVREDKRDMVMEYYTKALRRWDVPLLGAIPFKSELRAPTMKNLCKLLGASMIACPELHMRHFASTRLAIGIYGGDKPFAPVPNQLVVTHSTRTDVIDIVLENHRRAAAEGTPLGGGLILTGHKEQSPETVAALQEMKITTMKVPNGGTNNPTFDVLTKITEFTSKLDAEDPARLQDAIDHVTSFVDVEELLA